MTVVLPLELLLQIATLLHVEKVSLAPFTSVCRSWQSAFEPFIYSKLIIYSDDEHKYEGQTGIFLKKFQQLTSGNRAIRRTWIRELEYKILVPYNLPDWTTRKGNLWRNPENYTTDNPVRKANDVAFQAGVVDLFRELNSWDRNSRLSLILGILGCSQGEEPAPEPWTQYYQDAGEFRWDYRHGSRLSVPPYRARFVQDMPYLAHVPCIEKLTFQNWPRPHHIWTGAIKTIVQHCSNVIELHLNLDEYIRPDHLIYLQKRRAALASLTRCLPSSLRVLEYEGSWEDPWKPSLSGLNLIPCGIDSLSDNLRDLSMHLQELRFQNTPLAFDFLCPLNGEGKPVVNGILDWPSLKILAIEGIPEWLPSGESRYQFSADAQADIDEVIENNDWVAEICDVERGWGGREVRIDDHFQRLLISLGYAAQHMPCLKSLKFGAVSRESFNLEFQNAEETILHLECYDDFWPDIRVAKAWKFDMCDLTIDKWGPFGWEVKFPVWPPQESG